MYKMNYQTIRDWWRSTKTYNKIFAVGIAIGGSAGVYALSFQFEGPVAILENMTSIFIGMGFMVVGIGIIFVAGIMKRKYLAENNNEEAG